MIKAIKYVFFLLMLLQFSFVIQAQENDDIFILNNSLYKPKSNWITFGIGYAYNFDKKENELAGSLIYHAQIKKITLQAGYHLFTNESFISRSYQTMTNFTLGVGYRKETLKSNFAAITGPLYAYGKKGINENQYYKFNGLGFFINAEYTRKIFYDVGYGISLFYNFCSYYQVIGLQLHLYFSGALKARINQHKINY